MTQATDIAAAARAEDVRVISVVSAAHFVSHYYILLLPPLFLAIRDEYSVTFTELSIAIATFNIVSIIFQTPAGFLVDRMSARVALIVGLLLGAGAFAVAALVDSFWMLVVMFGVAGIGNTAYHPADYAMLSHQVSNERIGQAYSVHSFAGYAGTAAAPITLLWMESMWGWRGAFLASAALGFVVAIILMFQRDGAQPPRPAAASSGDGPVALTGWRLLMSGPILMNLLFFLFLATVSSGMNNYSVVALQALHDTPLAVGNAALTTYLTMTAIGVLAGGLVVARTDRHDVVSCVGLVGATLLAVGLAVFDFHTVVLFAVMAVGGFLTGIFVPSRDMIVRESTPPGSFGAVFGFVNNGFSLGGVVAPLILGALMDHGQPRLVFIVIAATCVLSIGAVFAAKPRHARI